MSTLKTNNLEHLDASSPNITLGIGGGVNISGIATVESGIHVTGGLVGIGTDDPYAPLHVEKDGTSQVLARFESNMGTINNRAIVLSSPTSDSGAEPFIFNTGNGYQFQTDDQVGLHINYNRNIGIGTNNPATTLSVAGNVRVQKSSDASEYLTINYQGIDFQNTGAGSSSTAAAHVLDDYEEGTWTPTFINGTWTYGKQYGRYTKIGNMVHIICHVTWTNRSGTGDLQINLPFTTLGSVSQDRYVGSFGYLSGVDLDSPEKQLINTVSGDRSALGMYVLVDNAGSVSTKVQNTSTGGEVQMSITIMVA